MINEYLLQQNIAPICRKTIYFVLPMLFAGVIGYSVMIADNTQYFQKTPMQISDFNPFSRFSTPEINAYKSISREIDYTHFEMESLDDFIEKYQPIIELEEDVFEDVEKENRFSKPVENSKNDELKY